MDMYPTDTWLAQECVAAVPAEVDAHVTRFDAYPLQTRLLKVYVVDTVQRIEALAPNVHVLTVEVPEIVTVPLDAAPFTVMLLYVLVLRAKVLAVVEVSDTKIVDVWQFSVPPVKFQTVPVPVRVMVPEPRLYVGVPAPALIPRVVH